VLDAPESEVLVHPFLMTRPGMNGKPTRYEWGCV
jgi:hypothetical protein